MSGQAPALVHGGPVSAPLDRSEQPAPYDRCGRCGFGRVANGVCLDCWWRPGDWRSGRMEPITDRIVWEHADGTRWQWQRDGDTWRYANVDTKKVGGNDPVEPTKKPR